MSRGWETTTQFNSETKPSQLTFAQILRNPPPEPLQHRKAQIISKEKQNRGKRKGKGKSTNGNANFTAPRILKRGETIGSAEPQIESCSIFDFITTSEPRGQKKKTQGEQKKIAQKKKPAPRRKEKAVQNPNVCASDQLFHFRGKERQTPKKKKNTNLKKEIIQERTAFHNQTESNEANPRDPVDFFVHETPGVTKVNDVHIKTQNDDGRIQEVTKEAGESQEQLRVKTIPIRQCAREYCDAVISAELNNLVGEMLSKLYAFQLRAKQKTPMKAKKRVVIGVREVERSVKRGNSKCIIIAYNLEQSQSLDEVVNRIVEESFQHNVPVVYALKKSALGKAFGKRMNMSFASIVSAEGAYDLFKQTLVLSESLRLEKKRIDKWMEDNNYNECGDPRGTNYGNNPREDSSSKVLLDPYRFLISKFPTKPWNKQDT